MVKHKSGTRWSGDRVVGPQKQGRRIFWFGPQNQQLWFGDLGIKITAIVSWFVPQNQADDGLSVAPQNQ
jgi:hypothetical protein